MATAEGRRVRLVALAEEDVDRLIRWRAEPEARQHQPLSVLGREQLLQHIQTRKAGTLAELADRDHILIIRDENQGLAVGWLTLEILSRVHGLARIGYTVSKEYWGRGYATGAVQAVCSLLFGETVVERIEADCSVHNPASRRVLEKCGFSHVGLKRSFLIIQKQRVDHYNFELLKDDWEAR
ncbi:MAG: GNAT family protein [Candidatus Neomarinimicrobiota bacterium]